MNRRDNGLLSYSVLLLVATMFDAGSVAVPLPLQLEQRLHHRTAAAALLWEDAVRVEERKVRSVDVLRLPVRISLRS